jgi:arginine deiminase
MDLEQLIGLLLSDNTTCNTQSALDWPDSDVELDTILMNPTVTLEQSDRNTPVTASSYKLNPLGNLVFTRDQVQRCSIVAIVANVVAFSQYCHNRPMVVI